jgi:long-subunit fatty acid transport protein
MKKILLILLIFYGLLPIANAQDVQRFAERSPVGTARYVGMGGAMTAIGGDPSAAMDNPAGLGLYRRSEISVSMNEILNQTQQANTNTIYQTSRFEVPQISAIWASGHHEKQRGLIYSNFMFNVNRLHSYKREVHINEHNTGMLQTMCTKTNGLSENDMGIDDIWYNDEIGWLSILAYDGYLIDPVAPNQWIPSVDFNNGELIVSENGSSDLYTLSWAGNINNQWYIGVGLNVPTITYTKRCSLYEYNQSHSAELKSLFHASGVGVNANVGLIVRPTQWLRIGASLQTPTMLAMSVQTEGDVYSKINGQQYEVLTPASGTINTKYAAPLRSSTSVAFQLKHLGMLSVQYDYAHAVREDKTDDIPMNDVHTLRAGLEAQVAKGWYLNAGYVYESSFKKEDNIVALSYNSIRTDTDYRFTQSSQYASAGLGYRNDFLVVGVAYQFGWQLLHQYATEHQNNATTVHTNTHRLVCTLAWRI